MARGGDHHNKGKVLGPNGRCKTCKFEREHPGLISGRLARGASFFSVAQEFGLDKEGVRRHWKLHVGDKVARGKIHRKAMALAPKVDLHQLAADSTVAPVEVCDKAIGEWSRDVAAAREREDSGALRLADNALRQWVLARSIVTRDVRKQFGAQVNVNTGNGAGGDQTATIHRVIAALRPFPEAVVAVREALALDGPPAALPAPAVQVIAHAE